MYLHNDRGLFEEVVMSTAEKFDMAVQIDGYATQGKLIQGVKMEVSLVTIAFPTVQLLVDSYVYQFPKDENMDIVDKYNLQPFTMNIQELERTFIDKVFAICDYYLQGKIGLIIWR